MKVLAIASNELRRLLRWRANLFFLFVLPMLIILLLGAVFGGSEKARIGVVGPARGALAQQFVAALRARPSTQVTSYSTVQDLRRAVAHGHADAGLVIPSDYDARLRQGAAVTLGYFARPDSVAQQLRPTVQSVAADQSRAVVAAQALERRLGVGFGDALRRSEALVASIPPIRVQLTDPGGGRYTTATGRFDSGASTQLLLFIFLTSLTAAGAMIETRRLGIARRILSTPTSPGTFVAGQLLGRLAVAIVQALIIVLGSMIFFSVSWGDPLGTAAVVLSFCLVGTGAALLVGSLCSSEHQAQPVAFLLGLGLAALGGSMAPLEVFPSTARAIAHITPHAWANDAFSKLLKHGGDLVAVLPQVGALLGFAAVAVAAAVWHLRRSLQVRAGVGG
jgi:linearmycin/streptolysin S transport system permease protein